MEFDANALNLKPIGSFVIRNVKNDNGSFMWANDLYEEINEHGLKFSPLATEINISCKHTEEKKEGNKMKLVEMYRERASKIIDEARKIEKESVLNDNPIVKKYTKLIEEFEKAQEELYMNQAIDNMIIDIKNSDNMYKYGISNSIRNAMYLAIDEKYNTLQRELDDKIREVYAHLGAIDMNSNSDNKVDLMYGILEEYGIIDSRLHIIDYKLPMEEIKEEVEEPAQEEAPKGKKRGRKPTKTDENK